MYESEVDSRQTPRRISDPAIEIHESGPRDGDLARETWERHHRRRYYPNGSPAEDHHGIRITRRYKSVRLWRFLERVLEVVAGIAIVVWVALIWTTGIFWSGMLGALTERYTSGAEPAFVIGIALAVWIYIITNNSPVSRGLFYAYSVGVAASAYVLSDMDPFSLVLVFALSLLLAPLVMTDR